MPNAKWLTPEDIAELAPFLESKWVGGIYESSAFDLDVHAIHSIFLRDFRRHGGIVRVNAEIERGFRNKGAWSIYMTDGTHFQVGRIVNAAGAWADDVARKCNAQPLGIRPLLRTVVVVDPECPVEHCPYIGTVDEQIFIKPDVGRLLVSPCDEILSAPCDALPDEFGIAVAMDRLESSTILRPNRIVNRWAGLRVFVPDRSPVLGEDSSAEGFYWCAALGGYGIQTAPAMARFCAALALNESIPIDLKSISATDVSPSRLQVLDIHDQAIVTVEELR